MVLSSLASLLAPPPLVPSLARMVDTLPGWWWWGAVGDGEQLGGQGAGAAALESLASSGTPVAMAHSSCQPWRSSLPSAQHAVRTPAATRASAGGRRCGGGPAQPHLPKHAQPSLQAPLRPPRLATPSPAVYASQPRPPPHLLDMSVTVRRRLSSSSRVFSSSLKRAWGGEGGAGQHRGRSEVASKRRCAAGAAFRQRSGGNGGSSGSGGSGGSGGSNVGSAAAGPARAQQQACAVVLTTSCRCTSCQRVSGASTSVSSLCPLSLAMRDSASALKLGPPTCAGVRRRAWQGEQATRAAGPAPAAAAAAAAAGITV